MDFGNLLSDAFAYTRDGVFGNVNRWLKLILAIICLGLPFNGYVMRIYRGVRQHRRSTTGGPCLLTA